MNKSRRFSLLGRAILAILLTIGFYGLALAIIAALFYFVYFEFSLGRINIRLTLLAVFGGFAILWAILPRIDRFLPPGPRLTPHKFADLFAVIRETAQETGQQMPREVYLIPDINAFVAERGGLLGIGSRRVMGIGLPLLQITTVDELRAILAHEFGHFYSGDTALGPWIYNTRQAIIRTVVNLSGVSSLIQAPFKSYAMMFLRVTNTISRHQEFSADRLAARVVGADICISSLKKVHKHGRAFQAYWTQEYLPVINNGFQPPLLEGFTRFVEAPKIAEALEKLYDEDLNKEKSDPYDSHPSLKERIAALEGLPDEEAEREGPAAITLLPDVEAMEDWLLDAIARDKSKIQNLASIDWKEVDEKVHIPRWRKNAETYRPVLKEFTAGELPGALKQVDKLFARIAELGKLLPPGVSPNQVHPHNKLQVCGQVFGGGLAVILTEKGWQVSIPPGEEIKLRKGKLEILPFNLLTDLEAGKISADDWDATCAAAGIADTPLVLSGEISSA